MKVMRQETSNNHNGERVYRKVWIHGRTIIESTISNGDGEGGWVVIMEQIPHLGESKITRFGRWQNPTLASARQRRAAFIRDLAQEVVA